MPKTATTVRNSRHASTQLTGPASLANVEARGLAKCQVCGSERVTSITMTLTDGTRVRFASCHKCENRGWVEEGTELSFDNVIAKSRKIA